MVRRGCVPGDRRCGPGRFWILGWGRGVGSLRDCQHRQNWPCGGSPGHFRSQENHLRTGAESILQRGARSDTTKPAGPDTGPQYRSAIFYSNPEQKRIAEAYISQLDQAKVFRTPIVTHVVELKAFYPAEAHHQNFCNRNPKNSYVVNVALPKIEKAQKQVPELVKKK